ncbi:MAG: hypothetical protein H8E21_05000 [Gammaproteobacteria bacterium]|nr:hypothetical protein [Gammaproteobacteria bacterium]
MCQKKVFTELIEDVKKQIRKHASFFHYPRKYEKTKELSIAIRFFEGLRSLEGRKFRNIKNGDDPPDIMAFNSLGEKIALELTELVNEDAINSQIQGKRSYFSEVVSWDKDNTLDEIQNIINKKSKSLEAVYSDAYSAVFLLLFTDEPKLPFKRVNQFVNNHNWEIPLNINEAYILFSYTPDKDLPDYPVMKLW